MNMARVVTNLVVVSWKNNGISHALDIIIEINFIVIIVVTSFRLEIPAAAETTGSVKQRSTSCVPN